MTNEIVTGERLQSIADIYIGISSLFSSNPNIEPSKCLDILTINNPFNNPRIVFIYPDVLTLLPNIIGFFKNSFVLITHNSDINIITHPLIFFILNHPIVIYWYAQNVCLKHPKLRPLPIGIANSQWSHGDLSVFEPFMRNVVFSLKEKEIYMNFNVNTSYILREECKEICKSKGIVFLESVSFKEHIIRLSEYKYCICPQGNGEDTHRIWECLYVKTIPIMLKTKFSMFIVEYYKLPVILLDSWDLLDIKMLPYMLKDQLKNSGGFNHVFHRINYLTIKKNILNLI